MQNTLATVPRRPVSQIPHRAEFGISCNDASVLTAVKEAFDVGGKFAVKAIIAGQLLLEKQASLKHGEWGPWIAKNLPAKSQDTITRWMAAAERVSKALSLHSVIDIQAETISSVLTLPEAELSERGREARQLFLDFTADKTISDCLRDVADGSSPDHRISRAANGKGDDALNRSKNCDRKDFPKFIQDNLKCVTAHLKHWKIFTPAQIEQTETHFKRSLDKIPTPLLDVLKKEITEELKRR